MFINYAELSILATAKPAADPRPWLESRYSGFEYCGVETDYDGYWCRGCYGCETGDDYCRGSQYDNLRVVSANGRTVLENLFGKAAVPNLNQIISKYDLDNPEIYEVETYGSYYGDEYSVVLPNRILQSLVTEWYGWPNANDNQGVYHYLNSKGQRVLGLSPLDNLFAALKAENNGRLNPLLKDKKKVAKSSVQLKSIVIPNKNHYAAVQPKSIPSGGIAGVLVKDGKNKKLIDGYHRTKWLDQVDGRKSAQYLVLS